MSSPWKKQPEDVVDSVLKRAEVSKIARHLQSRLALAQFKAKHGWEDLSLDTIEPKVEEELRRRRITFETIDGQSDSSSSASDMPYPSRMLMSSPLKAPLFSDAVNSSSGSSGHRKRTYMASFEDAAVAAAADAAASSPSKRFRVSPTAHRSSSGQGSGNSHHQLAQSSPIKPRRQQHFTTSTGPNLSFFQTRNLMSELAAPSFATPSDDEDDLLPAHSFTTSAVVRTASPPRTPPMQTRSLNRRSKEGKPGKSGEEGADLLMYLAASPSPAVKSSRAQQQFEIPTTPPQQKGGSKGLDLPSSMMITPGGGNLFPTTPGQGFDFSDFVNISPSPAQKPWKTPVALSTRTPLSVARKRLTFDEPMP